jgi:hypothetical protein
VWDGRNCTAEELRNACNAVPPSDSSTTTYDPCVVSDHQADVVGGENMGKNKIDESVGILGKKGFTRRLKWRK